MSMIDGQRLLSSNVDGQFACDRIRDAIELTRNNYSVMIMSSRTPKSNNAV